MAGATYNDPAQRLGRQLGQILKHALYKQIVEGSGEVYRAKVKAGDTVIFRQVVPYGATAANPNTFTISAAAHLMQEGVTPAVENISVLDTSANVAKYGALYGYTERQKSLGEDDVPAWMEEQLGERLGGVREQIYIGAMQGCTNRFYAGGTTRLTVDETLSGNLMDRITRSLRGNHAEFVREVVKATVVYGSQAIQPSFIDYTHTDAQADIEALPGYIAVKDYGAMTKVHEMEVGAQGSHRFVLSADMPKIIDAGAAVAGTGLKSTGASNVDVYQMLTVAKYAWGHVAFRGLDAIDYNHIPVSQKDKSDPTGERGYCSGTFYDVGLVTNSGWMAVTEFGVRSLA